MHLFKWGQFSRKEFALSGANSFLEELTLLRREGKKEKIVELLQLQVYPFMFNPIALRTAKTLWSFGFSECNRVNRLLVFIRNMLAVSDLLPVLLRT